jgi:hypothetical protein
MLGVFATTAAYVLHTLFKINNKIHLFYTWYGALNVVYFIKYFYFRNKVC